MRLPFLCRGGSFVPHGLDDLHGLLSAARCKPSFVLKRWPELELAWPGVVFAGSVHTRPEERLDMPLCAAVGSIVLRCV